MQTELDAALVSHKAVQQAKDHAKAELALVEQQLLNDRAARENQLQQHSSLVSLDLPGNFWTHTCYPFLAISGFLKYVYPILARHSHMRMVMCVCVLVTCWMLNIIVAPARSSSARKSTRLCIMQHCSVCNNGRCICCISKVIDLPLVLRESVRPVSQGYNKANMVNK